MKGISFDGVHSYTNLNMVLSSVNIPPATPKTNFVDIPGGDGSIDLSEALGEIKFNDRECEFVFTVFPTDNFEQKKRQVNQIINGRRMKIVVDKDPDYYWMGRCAVNEYASDKNIHQITIGATVEPYKYKKDVTMVTAKANKYISYDTQTAGGAGVRLDINEEDGTCTLNGTCTENTCFWLSYIPEETASQWVGHDVTIGYVSQGKASRIPAVQLSDEDENGLVLANNHIGVDAVTEVNGSAHLLVWVDAGDVYTDYVIQPFILIDGIDDGVEFTNGRKTVIPTILCAGDTTIVYGQKTINLNAGIHRNLNMEIKDGEHTASVQSDSGVVFSYQVGDL